MAFKRRRVDKTLESHLLERLQNIWETDPGHSMFGEFRKGLCRAPYMVRKADGSENKAKISWRKICKIIAKRAKKGGVSTVREARERCWMHADKMVVFLKSCDGKVQRYRSVSAVRVLCFLKDPTEEMWKWLNEASLAEPFDHFCSRGQERKGQGRNVCINGLWHGARSTRNANEDRKKCTHGALALCPGHGANGTKCIFTHPDGTLQRCRMSLTGVGPCECETACF